MSVAETEAELQRVPFQEHDLTHYSLARNDTPWLGGVLIIAMIALFIVVMQGWEIVREDNRMFVPLYFMPDTSNRAIDILASLAVVTAIMERAVEVFIGSTREIKRKLAGRYYQALQNLSEAQNARLTELTATGASDQIYEANEEIASLEKRREGLDQGLTSYRTGTRIRAMSFSLLFGFLIALAGLRVISPLLDVPYSAISNIQWAALQIVDIAGTAGIIAGGTSGIHSLIRNIGARTEQGPESDLDARTRPS